MKLGIALLRVSTDKQFHDGDSIATQQQRVDQASIRDDVTIVRYFTEHYSARKTNRAVIEDMLAFLDEHKGEIEYAYINEITRFTRAGSEMYLYLKRQLHERGVQLRDVMGVIQKSVNTLDHLGFDYEWSQMSPSRIAEVMQAEYANMEASQILTRTIGQQIKLAQEGYQTRSADFGFRNVKITRPDGKKATIMEPLEPEATWVRTIFELRAEGGWSDDAICEHLNLMGYQSRMMNRRDKATGQVIAVTGKHSLTPKQLQRIVSKPIYCGIRAGKWNNYEPIKTPFPGLVSIEQFNAANHGVTKITEHPDGRLELKRGESRKKLSWRENEEFLLRHVVMCPKCGKPFWASKSKGKSGNRFGYFHCARGHKRVSYSQREFQETVGNYLERLKPKPGFFGLFKEVVLSVWNEKNRTYAEQVKMVDEHISALNQKARNLVERLTTTASEIVQKKLEEEIEDVEAAIKSAERNRPSNALTKAQIEAFFAVAKKRLEHPKRYALDACSKAEIEKTWSTIFASPPTIQEIETGTPDLTLIYRLSSDPNIDERQMAADLSPHWNTFVDYVEDGLSSPSDRKQSR